MIAPRNPLAIAGFAAFLGLLVLLAVFARPRPHRTSPLPPPGNAVETPSITPVVVAGPKDLFEDVTSCAGLGFVHQFSPPEMIPFRGVGPHYRYWTTRLPFRGPGRDYPDPPGLCD